MGTKSTKKKEVAAPAAKAATKPAAAVAAAKQPAKRKVAVRPGVTAARTRKPATAEAKEPLTIKVTTTVVTEVEIPQGVVALRAYYIGEARRAAGQPGDSITDWLEAEREVRAEL